MAQLRAVPIQIKRWKKETPYEKSFITYELEYNTHDDTRARAYFCCPTNAKGKLPCVVRFHGGTMSKIIPFDILATGVCCLDIDVRAVDVAAELEEVDPERIVTYGGSQGGVLSIVASALSGRSKKCYTNETSYCCIHRRVELGSRIFGTTKSFLKKYPHYTDIVLENLTYFDMLNMVSLLKCPPLSVWACPIMCVCLSSFTLPIIMPLARKRRLTFTPLRPIL